MITDQKTIDALKELNYKQVYEKGKEDTRKEILDKIDELEFTNIVRMNSNLGANTTQDRIKEYIKQQLNQPKTEQ